MLKQNLLPCGITITYPGLRIEQVTPNYYNIFIWQPDSRDRDLPLHERRGWDQWSSAWIPVESSSEEVAEKIYNRISLMLTHELKENYYVDGKPWKLTHENGLSVQSQAVKNRRTGNYLEVLLRESE